MIDFAEAAYDLEAAPDEWLPKLVAAGEPLLNRGLGVVAFTCRRPPQPGPLEIDQLHVAFGPDDLEQSIRRLESHLDMTLLWPIAKPGMPKSLSQATEDHDPQVFKLIMRYFSSAKDGLGIPAFDPDGRGVYLIPALPRVTTLSDRSRERWQMLAAHFGAGYRLRRALFDAHGEPPAPTDLPYGAEIVIDPTDFHVEEAQGAAKSPGALNALRAAALTLDRARGKMRESDPAKALEHWRALVRGRWSTVDWFDSDGRRYVLGVPNAPDVLDPRGLTERETQVVAFANLGLTNQMIGYNLGISKGRVSTLLTSAMRKLDVKTRAQLVKKLRDFGDIAE